MQSVLPLLGICVGMQMPVKASGEFAICKGFGLIPGWVRLLMSTDVNSAPCKVPNFGCGGLKPHSENTGVKSPLGTLEPGSAIDLVNLFPAFSGYEENVLACCTYSGSDCCTAARTRNDFKMQFIRKNGHLGLGILSHFPTT